MADPETLAFWARLLRALAFVVLYVVIGFGPGFIMGILLANRLLGKGRPTYMELHEEKMEKAFEHNAQWDPTNERWKDRA